MMEAKFTPAYDNKIYQKYSAKTIQNKEKNKISFLQDLDLPYNKKVPLIIISYPLTDKNQVGLILDVMNGMIEQPVQLVIAGIGTEKFQKAFTDLAEKHSKKVAILPDDMENKRKMYAAADMLLASSDSADCEDECKNAMTYGVIPVMPSTTFAEDYDPVRERGNAFFYPKSSAWGFFAAFVRALENFRFPYDWKTIQVNAMEALA
ncbi:MAG: hypothetical protein V1908_04670 [Candidatus Peregrinibacteria bacterium]